MTIYEKLSEIQAKISVPKNQHNSFGNYDYRSCEDILAQATPLCKEHRAVLVLDDELVNVGDRYYVRASATLYDLESVDFVRAFAYAREELEKKGMDGSQITGSSSSYARKYALNGLFCLDDVKDSDFTNTGDKQKTPPKPPVSAPKPAPTNNTPKPQDAQVALVCSECGAEINEKVARYSLGKYKRCLCFNCQKKYAGK